MIIGIDFDGTCVTHEFPNIGKDIGAAPVLKQLAENGHKLILFTMRSDMKNAVSSSDDILGVSGNHLTEAVNWFKSNDIPLYGINVNPEQHTWTKSPKAYCHLYIDDAALGCPLVNVPLGRPYVNWEVVKVMLMDKGLIK
jgi:hypothetical protein